MRTGVNGGEDRGKQERGWKWVKGGSQVCIKMRTTVNIPVYRGKHPPVYRCLHLGGRRERRAALRGGCHDAPPCRCTSQKSASSTSPTTWVRPAVAVARRPLSVPVAVPLRRVMAVAAADTAGQLAAHPAAVGVQVLGILWSAITRVGAASCAEAWPTPDTSPVASTTLRPDESA